MSAILTAVAFVKSVSGTSALSGIATARLDDEEYVDFQYKAFNVSEGSLLEPIQANTMFVGKYVFESQLYVSVASLVYFLSFVSLLIRKITSPLSFVLLRSGW